MPTESDFEGTLVLEKLAEAGLVDDFYRAVDSDDLQNAEKLLRRARVDQLTIHEVLLKMSEGS